MKDVGLVLGFDEALAVLMGHAAGVRRMETEVVGLLAAVTTRSSMAEVLEVDVRVPRWWE